ncbi:MAG: ATP-binding protein [Cyanobacteria bacterium]|nr:ATP-binding protein [Cyanobacteriota bacterium]
MPFIGREKELNLLEERYRSSKAEFFVLYGRRRVGKTELLKQFSQGKPVIFYTAGQTEAQDNLNQLTERCQEFFQDSMPRGMTFKTVEGVLEYLVEKAQGEKLVVILDEFQYLVNADQSIPSLMQRFWDHKGRHANLMLVLCGSSISLMVDYALAEKSPLYGRRTGQLQLKPFDFRTAGEFFPDWSYQDKLLTYGALGGIPAYLNQFDPSISFEDNITRHILRKDTFLGEEAEFLLKTELRDIKSYTSILKAIAAGNTTLKDLTSKVSHTATSISSYLSNLQTLHLVAREVSLAERAPEKSKKGRYTIQDNFLNFWFRFVEPNMTLVEFGQEKALYQEKIQPALSQYMGYVFEAICQQYVLLYWQEAGLPIPRRIGKVWDKDYDLDVVAEGIDGSYLFGECKWSNKPVDPGIVHLLKERAEKSGLETQKAQYVLFSSGGFQTKVKSDKAVKLVSTEELFGK